MKYDVTLNGKIYEVEVERGEAMLIGVTDAPEPAPASAASAPAPAAAPAPVAKPAAARVLSGEVISSPMPGTILDVRVAVGDNVKQGQILLVLEAMKMENEIVASRDGRIAAVAVAKGSKVDTGTAMLSLES